MIIPSTRIFTAGEIETGAYLNSAVTNLGNFMLGKPITVLRQTANSSTLTAGAFTAISFSVADVNRDNNWNSGAPTLWTCNTAGWYRFAGQTSLSAVASAVTNRRNAWFKTPSGGSAAQLAYGANVDRASVNNLATAMAAQSVTVYMNAGDAMDLRVLTDGTGYTTQSASTGFQCWMSAEWVSL
jgi:hypothetical protein